MSITSIGSLGTGASSSSGTTLAFAPAATLEAGNVGLLAISKDNFSTVDGDNSEVVSVVDSVGNQYVKLVEFTNSNAAAAAGITSSLWMTRATTQLTTAGTVTITFANAITDKCCSFWEFSVGRDLVEVGSNSNGTDGAAGFGSLAISGLPSKQYLFFRALAKEANSTTQITPTASHTAITAMRSRNNVSAVIVRGEFIIATATSDTSNPTLAVTGDTASAFVALQEAVSTPVFTRPVNNVLFRRRRVIPL